MAWEFMREFLAAMPPGEAAERRQKALIGFVRSCYLCVLIRGLENLGAPLKDFNCCGAKLRLRCAVSRLAEPRSFLKKVLIVAVRSYGCGVLVRGLRNLGASRKGNGFILFACTKRTKSTPEVCEPLDSGDDSKLCRRRFQQSFPTARVEPGFSQKTAAKRL